MSETARETHVDDDGLWIPPELREFDGQIVIRTPKGTIQHWGDQPLDAYYGMVCPRHFGDVDDLLDPKNEHLAPDRVSIKPQGEEAVELTVDLNPDILPDGGDCNGRYSDTDTEHDGGDE